MFSTNDVEQSSSLVEGQSVRHFEDNEVGSVVVWVVLSKEKNCHTIPIKLPVNEGSVLLCKPEVPE